MAQEEFTNDGCRADVMDPFTNATAWDWDAITAAIFVAAELGLQLASDTTIGGTCVTEKIDSAGLMVFSWPPGVLNRLSVKSDEGAMALRTLTWSMDECCDIKVRLP